MNTNTQTTRLYHTALSPFCRKVRLVLAEKKIEVELVEERYWEGKAELLRRNPAGKLPVLRYRGNMMAESQAIAEYLDEAIPSPSLMPQTPMERHEVRRLCAWFDDKFHEEVTRPILNERVWKKITRSGYPDSRVVKDGLRAIKEHIDYLSTLLETRRWLAGNALVDRLRAQAWREHHAAQAGCRTVGRLGKPRRRDQEARRDAPYGGGEQGVRTLPLVTSWALVTGPFSTI